MGKDYLAHNHDDDYEVILYQNNPDYKFGKTGYEQYYEDILCFWRYLYNPEPPTEETYDSSVFKNLEEASTYYYDNFITDENDSNLYWRRDIFTDPSTLLFWFDFINGKSSILSKYSVKAIGDRTKVVKDDDIKAIYYGEIPNLIYKKYKIYNID